MILYNREDTGECQGKCVGRPWILMDVRDHAGPFRKIIFRLPNGIRKRLHDRLEWVIRSDSLLNDPACLLICWTTGSGRGQEGSRANRIAELVCSGKSLDKNA